MCSLPNPPIPKTKSLFVYNLILICVCNHRRLYSQRLKLKQSRDFGLWSQNVLNSQIRLIKSGNTRRHQDFPLLSATAWDRVISLKLSFSVTEFSDISKMWLLDHVQSLFARRVDASKATWSLLDLFIDTSIKPIARVILQLQPPCPDPQARWSELGETIYMGTVSA